MRKNLITIGAVAIVICGIFLIVVAAGRPATPAITVRHVKSIQSGDTTTLIFEISNHTASSYLFVPSAVEVHCGTVWAPCFKFSSNANGPQYTSLSPSCFITYQPEPRILPKGVPLRFRISAFKRLTGPAGFVRRVQLKIMYYRIWFPGYSLNPFAKNSQVYGPPFEVVSEEFEESPKNQAER